MPEEDRETAAANTLSIYFPPVTGSEGAEAHSHTRAEEIIYHRINISVCPCNVVRYVYTSSNPLFENAAYRF